MKKSIQTLLLASLFIAMSCKQTDQAATESTAETTAATTGGQENVVDESSAPNIVQTAQFIAKLSLGFICVGTAVLAVMCAFAGMEAEIAANPPPKMPFDGMRMFWGGFAPVFDSDKG